MMVIFLDGSCWREQQERAGSARQEGHRGKAERPRTGEMEGVQYCTELLGVLCGANEGVRDACAMVETVGCDCTAYFYTAVGTKWQTRRGLQLFR